ncbi:hypothetical protein KC726_04740, partial [Candidatus Woesebacteria bacterium]|nr:hypothetical protein [Candidatus Woesebacteria bacterium]
DGIVINYDDYYNNNYLFVITKDVDFMSNPAYEVHSFTPSTMIDQWELNDTFTMYLLQRTIDE